MPKVSVIIPYYNKFELVYGRLYELYIHAPQGTEIVLVNDCSTQNDDSMIGWWQKEVEKRHTVKYVKNQTNLGFSGSHNKGVLKSSGEILAFLSSDVVVKKDFITPLCKMLEDDPNQIIGGRIIDWDGGWNRIRNLFIPYAEGYFIGCTRKAFEDLGGWDTRYSPYDMEDVDLSTTAYWKGYKVSALPDGNLYHIGGQTISTLSTNRQSVTEEHRKMYLEKWEPHYDELVKRLGNGCN